MIGIYLAVLVVTAACMLHGLIADRDMSMVVGGAAFGLLWTGAMGAVYLVWTAIAGHTPSAW